MKPWTRVAETTAPDRTKLTLFEHDGEYVLRVNGRELMSSRRVASEVRLGELGGLAAVGRASPRILVGGLGLGFTLRAALAAAPSDAEVVVAELLADVVAWNRRSDLPLGQDALADPRTRVIVGDVFKVIAGSAGGFDAILLDADNGTTAMMTEGNRRLYLARGIAKVRAALRPGGVAVYWSAAAEHRFAGELRSSGFTVRIEEIRAYGRGGPKHMLVIATPRATEAQPHHS